MGRMYTLDNKLLCGSPEVRIGERVYPIDDRQKTVKKAMKLLRILRVAAIPIHRAVTILINSMNFLSLRLVRITKRLRKKNFRS